MAKIIQFPIARVRQHRLALAGVFAPFVEMELLETAQLKLLSACFGSAALLTLALEIVAR